MGGRKFSKEIEDKLDSALPDKKDKKTKNGDTRNVKKAGTKKDKEMKKDTKKEKRIVVKVDLPQPAINGLLKAAQLQGGNMISAMQAKIWVKE